MKKLIPVLLGALVGAILGFGGFFAAQKFNILPGSHSSATNDSSPNAAQNTTADTATSNTPNTPAGTTTGNATNTAPNPQGGTRAGNATNTTPNTQGGTTTGNAANTTPNTQAGTTTGNAANTTPNTQGGTTAGNATNTTPNVQGGTTAGNAANTTPNVQGGTTTGNAVNATPNVQGGTTTGNAVNTTPNAQGGTTAGGLVNNASNDQNTIITSRSTSQPDGFKGGLLQTITVEQANKFIYGTWIKIRGNIIEQIGDEEYLFRDRTGSIKVGIEDKYWNGKAVNPKDLIEITGELIKNWNSSEINAKKVEILSLQE